VCPVSRRPQARRWARDYSADFALLAWTPAGPLPINLGLRPAAGRDTVAPGAVASHPPDGTAPPNVIIVVRLYAAWTRIDQPPPHLRHLMRNCRWSHG
jgi:hypothetical protein